MCLGDVLRMSTQRLPRCMLSSKSIGGGWDTTEQNRIVAWEGGLAYAIAETLIIQIFGWTKRNFRKTTKEPLRYKWIQTRLLDQNVSLSRGALRCVLSIHFVVPITSNVKKEFCRLQSDSWKVLNECDLDTTHCPSLSSLLACLELWNDSFAGPITFEGTRSIQFQAIYPQSVTALLGARQLPTEVATGLPFFVFGSLSVFVWNSLYTDVLISVKNESFHDLIKIRIVDIETKLKCPVMNGCRESRSQFCFFPCPGRWSIAGSPTSLVLLPFHSVWHKNKESTTPLSSTFSLLVERMKIQFLGGIDFPQYLIP